MPLRSPALTRRRFAALAASAAAAACSPRGVMTVAAPPPGLDGAEMRLLVATARQETPEQPIFTRGRAEPTYGVFDVWVPPDRAVGSVTFPTKQPPDFATDFVTTAARRLADEDAFVRALNRRLAENPRYQGKVNVFVHGYNTSFAEGLYRHAQLQHDYGDKTAGVHFSWPSAASAKGYVYDRESVLYSRDALESLLAAIGRSNAREINLVAHSMGAFLMMETLRVMARTGHDRFFAKAEAVLLLSPDIEIDVFRKEAPPVLARGLPIFVVVSTRDRALLISMVIRAERTPRLGAVASAEEIGLDEITVIDLSDVDAGGGMGHFAIARSPELIEMLKGLRNQGIDVLESERKNGILSAGIAVIQGGADILKAPLEAMSQ